MALSRKESAELYEKLRGDYDVVTLKHEKLFAVSGLIPTYGWNYICTVSYNSIYQAITLSSQSFFLIMVLAVILWEFSAPNWSLPYSGILTG